MSKKYAKGMIRDGVFSPSDSNNHVNKFAVYDRVINVLFIRRDKSSFCLRSDFEARQGKDGKYYFHKCTQKPEIKVEYKRVAETVSLELDLQITNLHMVQSKSQAQETFSNKNNAITHVIVQLGYFNQFPNFSDPLRGYKIDHYNKLHDKRKKDHRLYEELAGQVLAIYPTSMPPDAVTTFKCAVAFIECTAIPEGFDRTFQDLIDNPIGNETLQEYLFRNISQRYITSKAAISEVLYGVSDSLKEVKEAFESLRSRIVPCLSAASPNILGGQTDVEAAREEGRFNVKMPVMDEKEAKLLGMQVEVTETLEKEVEKSRRGAEDVKVPISDLSYSNTLSGAIKDLQEMFSFLRAALVDAYTLIFYHKDDTPQEIYSYLNEKGYMQPLDGLAAVYSITYSGLRAIKCPFTTLVKPFQTIKFSTRYNVGSLVGYYYQPEKGDEKFTVISFTVSFSTTGEENQMELLTSDAEE